MTTDSVLIIEDDPTLLRVLKDNFEFQEYDVRTAVDGEKGLRAALTGNFALVILDIMLPEINGYEVCRRIRQKRLDVPIIMLTAKGQESDIVLGLNLGADDYVTKPFSIKELLARAEAILRRHRPGEPGRHQFGDCELNLVSHRLFRAGREVPTTPKEFALLAYLVQRAGRAVTRDDILASVWGNDVLVTRRSVDRCVNTLRNKIEPDPHHPSFIQTVREIGYRFEMPETRESGA